MKFDLGLFLGVLILIITGVLVLRSIAPFVFPVYFIYIFLAIVFFLVFSQIPFDVLSLFSKHFYVGSVIFLALPILIGQVTRGAVRWISVGALTIQPAEIVRPFLLVFFANYLATTKLKLGRVVKSLALFAIPLILIVFQPSLGVSILTFIGFVGILIACDFDKKSLLFLGFVGIFLLPLTWFLLAPYQRIRITTFLSPGSDPTGAGYNSLQSMISVGSGKLFGRGLGQGVQTQLAFLPERHTDFIFASIAEEMGFLGTTFLGLVFFFVFFRLTKIAAGARDPTARAFVSGIFLTLFAQTIIHIGMNMGLFPITGLPLPLVSAGGSSLVSTMTALGMVVGARKRP